MPTAHDHLEDHDRGLSFDLATLASRRRALQVMAAGGVLALVGCSSDGSDEASSTTTTTAAAGGATTSTTAGSTSTEVIPEETAGPYPGDGSNGPDVLAEDGVVRGDIRSSFAGASGTAEGEVLTMELVVQEAGSGTPLAGHAVYAWHCDAEGRYSMYSAGVEDENYLRGVQESGADGVVRFTTVFPGCYVGRWPHVHFEVYASVDDATGGGEPIATSQLAFPEDVCAEVYASDDAYAASVQALAGVSIESDMIFSDSIDQQLGTMSGSVGSNLAVSLPVPI